MYCIHCGQELPNQAKFCSQCGAAVGVNPQHQEERPLVIKEDTRAISHKPTEKEMAELRMVIGDVLAFNREHAYINIKGYLVFFSLCDENALRIYPDSEEVVGMRANARAMFHQLGYKPICQRYIKDFPAPKVDDIINELRIIYERVYEVPFTGWGITAPLVGSEEDICRSEKPSNDLPYLLDKISRVRNHGGWLTVCIKDYYVQFRASGADDPVRMEAVSARNLKKVGDKTTWFSRLGYQLGEAEYAFNYVKECDLSGEEILKEFQYIFEHIYGVAFKNWKLSFSVEPEVFGQQDQVTPKAHKPIDLYEVLSNVRSGIWDYAIISIGDCFMQFCSDEGCVHMEAHLRTNPEQEEVEAEWQRIGFVRQYFFDPTNFDPNNLDPNNRNEYYYVKEYEDVADDAIVAEMKYVFEEIYGVEFSGWYVDYSENIPYEGPKEETQTEEEPTPSEPTVENRKVNRVGNEDNDDVGCLPLLIPAILIGLLYLLHRWLF